FLQSRLPLWLMSKTLLGPAYRHIFGGGRVEAEEASIRVRCKIPRATSGFDTFRVRADGAIARSRAGAGGCNANAHETQARHRSLTPIILRSSVSAFGVSSQGPRKLLLTLVVEGQARACRDQPLDAD